MLLIGIEGHSLRAVESAWVAHPAVAGVALFRRNYGDPAQLRALVAQVRAASPSPRLLAVDQEGGRVQRFVDGFSMLPALARIGERYAAEPSLALELARQHAQLMVAELQAHGLDLCFAPVVDLGRGSRAIGDRAFSADVDTVCALTKAYVLAMQAEGMPAILKHFPGHGSVLQDTHVDVAVDPRDWGAIVETDLRPFVSGIQAGAAAVMAAHVRYPAVCDLPAGYSRRWLGELLRGELGFEGAILSDDIGMAAAHSVGGVRARVSAHLDAGCDVVLACHPELVEDAIAAVEMRGTETANPRLALLSPRAAQGPGPEALAQARANLAALV